VTKGVTESGVQKLPEKTRSHLNNFWRQKGDTKQFPYYGDTSIRHHSKKFRRQGELATGISSPQN